MHARISGRSLNRRAPTQSLAQTPPHAATQLRTPISSSVSGIAAPCLLAMAGLLSGAAMAQDNTLARNLAATCSNCHGTNGVARGDMKNLAGVSAEKIIAAVADYKSGAQPATIMHQISKGYTDEQIRLVAAYFASKPAPK